MARTKGSKNKSSGVLPHYATLAPKERVSFLANLIVDVILSDQQNGGVLFKKVARDERATQN